MPRLRVEPEGRVLDVPENANLREALLREGVGLYPGLRALFNCGGRARCTSCAVMVTAGEENLSPRTPLEKARVPDPAPRMRLACQANVRGDCAIALGRGVGPRPLDPGMKKAGA
jgi:ferredoxin